MPQKTPVKAPGSRGGQYFYDKAGRIQYGVPPAGLKRKERRPEQVKQHKQERLTARHHQAAKAFKANYPKVRGKVMAHVGKWLNDAKVKVFHAAMTAGKTWVKFEHFIKKAGLDPEHLVLHALVHVPHLIDMLGSIAVVAESLTKAERPDSGMAVLAVDGFQQDYPAHRFAMLKALEVIEDDPWAAVLGDAIRVARTWSEFESTEAIGIFDEVFINHPELVKAVTGSLTGRRRHVHAPGSRGGKFYWTSTGNPRYGKPALSFENSIERTRKKVEKEKAHVQAVVEAVSKTGGVVRLPDAVRTYGEPPSPMFAVLTRNTVPDQDPYRATVFDVRGVATHDVGKTPAEALYNVQAVGSVMDIRPSTPDEFHEFSKRPSFTEGNRRTILLQHRNRITYEAGKVKPYNQTLADTALELDKLVAAGDLDAAEKFALSVFASLRTPLQKAIGLLQKARVKPPGQLNLFGGREVQHPGIRGGDYWYDERGQVRYGPRPKGEMVAEPGPLDDAMAELAALEEERKRVPHTPLERLTAVMKRFGVQVTEGTTARGNPCINMVGATQYGKNPPFRGLKSAGVIWWWDRDKAWCTFADRIDRVIEAFGGEHGESVGGDIRGAGPAVEGPAAEPSGHRLPGGRDDGLGAGPGQGVAGSVLQGTQPIPLQGAGAGGDVGFGTAISTGVRPAGRDSVDDAVDAETERVERLIAELSAIQPPEPKTPFPASLLDQLGSQGAIITPQNQLDVCRIVDAYQRGDRAFLAGNGTGTGKTFLGLGALWVNRPKRALIVVPNQGVADQWKEDGAKFGLVIDDAKDLLTSPLRPGIYVTTYAGLRTHTALPQSWDMAIFDEVHREATKLWDGKQTAKLVAQHARGTKFTIYATATPFERPYDASYLFQLGLWDEEGKWRTEGSELDFRGWTQKHGVEWRTQTVRTPYGNKEVDKPVFKGGDDGRVVDMLRIRAAIVGAGKGVFREIEVTEPLNTVFENVEIAGEYADVVGRAIRAMEAFPDSPMFKAQRINIAKRLLDYVKLDHAVDLAADAIKAGKRVAVFISNVSPFVFDKISDEELRMVDEEGRPIVPFVRRTIQETWNAAGLSRDPKFKRLPSPTEMLVKKLRERLGEKAVMDYTGKVVEGRRKKIKTQFQKGELPVIVATIAAGGTGLSLHDTIGNAPRYQINVGLPWTGKDLQQMIGRTYRVGVKSPVEQAFLLTPHRDEQHVAAVVAGKLESMRAGVNGIVADTNVAHLVKFTLDDTPDEEDEMEKAAWAWAEFFFATLRLGALQTELVQKSQALLFDVPAATPTDRWFLKCPTCKKPFAIETERDQGQTAVHHSETATCPHCGHTPEHGAQVEVFVWKGAEAPQRTWKFKTPEEADKFAAQLRDQIHEKGWPHNVRVMKQQGQTHKVMGKVPQHNPNFNIPCNASCFYAPGPNCECSCGGRNHGKGRVVVILGPRPADAVVKSDALPKCPRCGSRDVGLMPPDFETVKCAECARHHRKSNYQLADFKKAEDPARPGSRGGQYYLTHAGHIRYGEPPAGSTVASGAGTWQVGMCHNCDKHVMMRFNTGPRTCPNCGQNLEVTPGQFSQENAERYITGGGAVLRTTQEEPAAPPPYRVALKYDPERDLFVYHDETGDTDVPPDRLAPVAAQSQDLTRMVNAARVNPHNWQSVGTMRKAMTQLGLFSPRKDPEQPGVRGGHYYRTETGRVRYGERPIGESSEPAVKQEPRSASDPKADVYDGVLRAIRERPSRMTHGNTGKNAFIVVGDRTYSWDKQSEIPAEQWKAAITVHSHSPETWSVGEDLQPLNSADVDIFLRQNREKGVSRDVIIAADGQLEMLQITERTDPAVFKLKKRQLEKLLHRDYEERSRYYEEHSVPDPTNEASGRRWKPGYGTYSQEHELLRAFCERYRIRYFEGLRWREAPARGSYDLNGPALTRQQVEEFNAESLGVAEPEPMPPAQLHRIVGKRPAEAPPGWRVYNAPRPLLGHKTWQGDFQHGIFYAAIDPNDAYELRPGERVGEVWERQNIELDAWRTEWIEFGAAKEELRKFYQENYGSELNVDEELAEFSERELVQMWAQHFGITTTSPPKNSDLVAERSPGWDKDLSPREERAMEFEASIRKRFPGVKFDIHLDDRHSGESVVNLDFIEVRDRAARKHGTGTAVMEELTRWADRNGYAVTLSLAEHDTQTGTTSRERLARFYSRFGFVRNRGRHKDYSLSMYASMYRRPVEMKKGFWDTLIAFFKAKQPVTDPAKPRKAGAPGARRDTKPSLRAGTETAVGGGESGAQQQPEGGYATVHGPDRKGDPAQHAFRVVRGEKPGHLKVAPEHRGRVRQALSGQVEAVPIEELCRQFECTPSPELGVPVPNKPEQVVKAIEKACQQISKQIGPLPSSSNKLGPNDAMVSEELQEDAADLAPLWRRLLKGAAKEAGGEVDFGEGEGVKPLKSTQRKAKSRGNIEHVRDSIRATVVVDRPDQMVPAVEAVERALQQAGGEVACENGFELTNDFGTCAVVCHVVLSAGSGRRVRGECLVTLRAMRDTQGKIRDVLAKYPNADLQQVLAASQLLSLAALLPFSGK